MAKDPKSDSEIVKLIKQKEGNKAIKLLYQTRKDDLKSIVNYVMNNSGSKEEGLMILDDAVTEFWANCDSGHFDYNPESTLDHYIFGVARNMWLSELKRKKRDRPVDPINFSDKNTGGDDPDPLSKQDLREILTFRKFERDEYLAFADCFEKLSEKKKQILLMRDYDEKSYEEIAILLAYAKPNVSEDELKKAGNVVKQTLSRLKNEDLDPCLKVKLRK
ncbi:MAG: sigma-70 family RNA polymerase sigma factor [Saprospiraceae bacterium]|nr:sigma-70 family RNA polymerase sigma factor [Saprospiraceae bacterium]